MSATTTLVQAQRAIPAGTVSLGGSIGYHRDSDDGNGSVGTTKSASSTFHGTSAVGYFVADNLVLGLNAGYVATGREAAAGGTTGSTTSYSLFRIGPYVQYYHLFSDQFGVLATLGLGYLRSSESISGSGKAALKSNGHYGSLTPGIVFFLIPTFGLSASIGAIGYQRRACKLDGAPGIDPNHVTSLGATFGLDELQFGGTYYFGR